MAVLKTVTKEDTTQYVLATLLQMLQGGWAALAFLCMYAAGNIIFFCMFAAVTSIVLA
jgi:hypothetical protein